MTTQNLSTPDKLLDALLRRADEIVADMTPEQAASIRRFIMTRPVEMWPLIRQFPPSCFVRSAPGHRHRIPDPTDIGILMGYGEPTEHHPEGSIWCVSGRAMLGNALLVHEAQCLPESLVVAGYSPGLDPETINYWFAH